MSLEVAQYYDELYRSYARRWSKDHLHMGIWDENTVSHKESLINTIDEIIKLLKISKKDIVLDAGCGVGGSAIYITNKFKCKITGITYSDVLLRVANNSLRQMENKSKIEFFNMDFANTSFEDKTFTKIYGLESVSHGLDKIAFAKEAYRLLKENGKLVISDGFLMRENLNTEDEQIYHQFLKGWALPHLETPMRFKEILSDLGFTNIKYIDKTEAVMKSVKYLHKLSTLARIAYFIPYKFGKISEKRYLNALSASLLKKCVHKNITGYGFLRAEKLSL